MKCTSLPASLPGFFLGPSGRGSGSGGLRSTQRIHRHRGQHRGKGGSVVSLISSFKVFIQKGKTIKVTLESSPNIKATG